MMDLPYRQAGTELCEAVTFLHSRGWCSGTGGNFSVRVKTEPLRFLISPSGADKGTLVPEGLVLSDKDGVKLDDGLGKPSAETLLHAVIYEERGAGSVLHTHSVWNTVLSSEVAAGNMELTGWEMIKGLEGVRTHEHTEIVPTLTNSQDMPTLARRVRAILGVHPEAHGFLLAGHGLYTWGATIAEARRHVEIFEFLFEVEGTRRLLHGNR
jgi:methylthioribulose-1-phosphate dehydratase